MFIFLHQVLWIVCFLFDLQSIDVWECFCSIFFIDITRTWYFYELFRNHRKSLFWKVYFQSPNASTTSGLSLFSLIYCFLSCRVQKSSFSQVKLVKILIFSKNENFLASFDFSGLRENQNVTSLVRSAFNTLKRPPFIIKHPNLLNAQPHS